MRQWTRDLAWAASKDGADRAMRAAGRTAWNAEDYNVAVAEFERLFPEALEAGEGEG